MTDRTHRNRLRQEPSLYLQQHAANPVDWYPWCDEAFERANAEDKPILLSIGYSACHWCHVMERESFENEQIAALMNELFVCIKVDREERPDLDHIYMRAVQAMTQHGGWPMTVFLTPDGKPFYAGTYFPPEDRGGMPGFPRVLSGVARAYHEERDKVLESADRVVEVLVDQTRGAGVSTPTVAQLEACGSQLCRYMDPQHGGFGTSPKFPATMSLSFLMGLERWRSDETRRRLLRTSLDGMASGGIYDQLGGGFHRYSVDRIWLVPHFEKMLYDQALLAPLYAEAWQLFGEDRYLEIAGGILDYVRREMTAPEGGFYATQDADSEGVEGKFFVWTRAELADALQEENVELISRVFGITQAGNFEGANILHRAVDDEQVAKDNGMSVADLRRTVRAATGKMLAYRARRIPPARDEKILADWNGLMIGAMAVTARILGRDDLVETAARAADFLCERMYGGGRLQHFFADGVVRVDGFLDDYAFVGRGCLELFFATGRRRDLQTAVACAETILDEFLDGKQGGFYFTSAVAEPLVVRAKETHDAALPAGGAVAVELLLRLHALTGDARYLEAADRATAVALEPALANPYGSAHLLNVVQRRERGFVTVVVSGSDAQRRRALEGAALRIHCPEASVLQCPQDTEAEWLPSALRGKASSDAAAAFVCRGMTCGRPQHDAAGVADELCR